MPEVARARCPRRRLAALVRHTVPPSRAGAASEAEEKAPKVPLLSRPLAAADLTSTAYEKALTVEDIASFKQNGLLVKKGLLDPAKVEFARNQVWDAIEGKMPWVPGCPEQHMHLASPGVTRDDEASWMGANCNHPDHGGGLRSLGHLPWMLDLVPNDPDVRAIAEQMLGPLRPSLRTRGVYSIFPSEERQSKPLSGASLGPHNDNVCQTLNVMCYLEDCGPRCGGFTLWPGSHKLMYHGFTDEFNCVGQNARRPEWQDLFREAISTIEPLECCGEKGDVIWWHGRTLHSAGIHHGSNVRLAIPGDFQQAGRRTTPAVRPTWPLDDSNKANGLEWFKDTLPFADVVPPQEDMWASWRI